MLKVPNEDGGIGTDSHPSPSSGQSEVTKFHEIYCIRNFSHGMGLKFVNWLILILILKTKGIFGQRCYNNKRIKIKFK